MFVIISSWLVTAFQVTALICLFLFWKTGDVSYCWSLFPYGACSFISTVANCFSSSGEISKSFVVFIGTSRILLVILACNITLKVIHTLTWSWTEVFWPVWLQLSIFVGVSFVTLSMVCGRVTAYIKKRQNSAGDLLATLVINFHLVGLLAFTILLERGLCKILDGDNYEKDSSFLKAVLLAAAGYSALLFTYMTIYRRLLS